MAYVTEHEKIGLEINGEYNSGKKIFLALVMIALYRGMSQSHCSGLCALRVKRKATVCEVIKLMRG